jgi:hypothetical protein
MAFIRRPSYHDKRGDHERAKSEVGLELMMRTSVASLPVSIILARMICPHHFFLDNGTNNVPASLCV